VRLSTAAAPTPRICRAETELDPAELQDLVEGLGEIRKASAGLELRFVLRLEVGDQRPPSEEELAPLNAVLMRVCPKLQFSRTR